MARKAPTAPRPNGRVHLPAKPAPTPPAPTLPTRHEAFAEARRIAVEEFHEKRAAQDRLKSDFALQYGAIAKIDKSYADDVRRLLMRTVAIAKASKATYNAEAKIDKLAGILSDVLGRVELLLAQDVAQDLFGRIDEREYLESSPYRKPDIGSEPESWVGDGAVRAKAYIQGLMGFAEPALSVAQLKAAEEREARNREHAQRARDSVRISGPDNCSHEETSDRKHLKLDPDEVMEWQRADGSEAEVTRQCAHCLEPVVYVGAVKSWMVEQQFEAYQINLQDEAETA